MKKILFFLLFILCTQLVKAQSLYFPPSFGNTWDTVSVSSLGWCQNELDTLINFLDTSNSKGFIILKDGKIAVEHYFDQFTKDSVWYWASAGKSLTAFMVGLAQQDGFLSINDTSSKYMGQGWTIAPTVKEDMITVKNQLSMSSGLDDGLGNADCTDDTCLQYLADAGTRWSYHNGPYTLLDSVVENATGSNLNGYVANKLTLQTGFTGSYIRINYNNVFFSKPRSMARFGLLCLNRGKWNTTTIMSDTNYFNEMINSSQSLNPAYGYLWWLNGKATYKLPSLQLDFNGSLTPSAPNDMYSAMGKNGQVIHVIPSQNIVVVRIGDNPDNSLVPTTFTNNMWERLSKVFCNSTAIENTNLNNQIKLFPNPVSNQLNIKTDLVLHNATLTVLSLEGKVMLESTFTNSLNINSLPKGVYILRIKADEGIVQKRIIKQ